jgi:hypothetical protein
LEARDNMLIMGLLSALGEVGTPMTDERRGEAVAAFEAALKILYPRALSDPEARDE